jgi:hypothetical protein
MDNKNIGVYLYTNALCQTTMLFDKEKSTYYVGNHACLSTLLLYML